MTTKTSQTLRVSGGMSGAKVAELLKSHGSQGAKVVRCVACHSDIQPYAGRPVSLIGSKYAHHPGQCVDHAERASQVRDKAVQGELFAWRCDHVEPASGAPVVCHEFGTGRGDFESHMRAHGQVVIKTERPIKLRAKAPAARLPKLDFPVFKYFRWTETGIERRGQFWSLAEAPHSVWVVPLEPAPWEQPDRPAKPVELHAHGDGTWSMDWSRAKYDRRDASRRARRSAAVTV